MAGLRVAVVAVRWPLRQVMEAKAVVDPGQPALRMLHQVQAVLAAAVAVDMLISKGRLAVPAL